MLGNTADHNNHSLESSAHPAEQPRRTAAAPEMAPSITSESPHPSVCPAARPANAPQECIAPATTSAAPAMATKVCAVCGGTPGSRPGIGRDGMCGGCRLSRFGLARRKMPQPSPELLQELKMAYSGNQWEVSQNLKRVSRKWGWPVGSLKYEGHKRGWRTQAERKPWRPEEAAYLREKLGTVSLFWIAKKVGHSVCSVVLQARRLGLSTRFSEGYNISNLVEVFGLSHTRIESWARRGLLGKAHGKGHGLDGAIGIRFKEEAVMRFIRKHPSEYDLSRVDQIWFKAMLFGADGAGQ